MPLPRFRTETAQRLVAGLLLAAILVGGGILRFSGLEFGLPFALRYDEEFAQQQVAQMAERGTLEPTFFAYGGLYFHTLYVALRVEHVAMRAAGSERGAKSFAEFVRDTPFVCRTQRVLSALLGIATIALVFEIGRRAHSLLAGLAGAALVAGAFLPARDSHFGTVDTELAFFVALGLLATIAAMQSGRAVTFALAALAIGAAAAVKYVPLVLVVPLAAAGLVALRRSGVAVWSWPSARRTVLLSLGVVAAGLLCAPYTLLSLNAFLLDFRWQASLQQDGGGSHPLETLAYIATGILPPALGVPLAVTSLAALAFVAVRGNAASRILALAVVTYAAAMSIRTLIFYRHTLPLLPPLLALAAVMICDVASFLPRRLAPIAVAALTAALLVDPVSRVLELNRLFRTPTTVELTARFLREQVPKGCPVVSPMRTPALGFGPELIEWWDPPAIAESKETYVVLVRHPQFMEELDPAVLQDLLDSTGKAEVVLRERGFRIWGRNAARFDPFDAFFFPVSHFEAVLRGGPDVEIVRVRGWLSDREPKERLRAVARLAETEDGLVLRLESPPADTVRSVLFRGRRIGASGPGAWTRPELLAPGAREVSLRKMGSGGTVELEMAARTDEGMSAWSETVTAKIP